MLVVSDLQLVLSVHNDNQQHNQIEPIVTKVTVVYNSCLPEFYFLRIKMVRSGCGGGGGGGEGRGRGQAETSMNYSGQELELMMGR